MTKKSLIFHMPDANTRNLGKMHGFDMFRSNAKKRTTFPEDLTWPCIYRTLRFVTSGGLIFCCPQVEERQDNPCWALLRDVWYKEVVSYNMLRPQDLELGAWTKNPCQK